jgi:RNA polymerase sigma-70 factor (ECF subfamily)
MDKNAVARFVGALFREHSRDLRRYLASRMDDPHEAQDLAQEAFLRILRLDKVDFIQNPEAYLYRIAANLAYERRLKHLGSPVSGQADVSDLAEELEDPQNLEAIVATSQDIESLEETLKALAPNARAALLMQRRDGMTYDEIAGRLGVSTSMVKKYLQAALVQCRQNLSDEKS